METRMHLKGSLKVTTFPEILHSICVSKETGILSLQQFNIKKKIYFEEGKVSFAYSNQRRDSLGDILLRNDVITLEQYLDTARQIRPGVRHGQILLKEGFITTQELISAVHTQVKEIIYSLFEWTEGMYEFEKEEKRPETIKLSITSSDLILAGVKRICDWSVLEKMIGNIDNILEESPEFEQKKTEIQLTEQETDIMNYARGRTFREVLNYTLLSDYETCRLLAGLITIDLFRIRKHQYFILEPVVDIDSEKLKRMGLLFNNIFEHIHATLVNESGPMAEKILHNYFAEVRQEEKALLHNIEMASNGWLDMDLMDLNIMNLDVPDRTDHVYSVYLKILNSHLKATRELLGEDKRADLETDIKNLVSRLSAEK